jgi:hypothetical protein
MITDSNQVAFWKVPGCSTREGIIGPKWGSPPQLYFEDALSLQYEITLRVNDYG